MINKKCLVYSNGTISKKNGEYTCDICETKYDLIRLNKMSLLELNQENVRSMDRRTRSKIIRNRNDWLNRQRKIDRKIEDAKTIKKRRAFSKNLKVCVNCSNPAQKGHIICEDCIKARKEWHKRYKW